MQNKNFSNNAWCDNTAFNLKHEQTIITTTKNKIVNKFSEILDCTKEETVQKYLEKNPSILLAAFGDRWEVNECLPKFKFGNEFISDFVIVSGQSFSYNITLIELEPPTESIFTKNGKYAKRLNDAISQVNNWTSWIHDNMHYFRSSVAKKMNNKYGAEQIASLYTQRFFVSAKIIIGRRSMLSNADNNRRASILAQTNKTLEIIPYDRLLEIESKIDGTQKSINKLWDKI